MTAQLCGHNGGQGIGAGHTCRCNRPTGHPHDSDRPHGCECGAPWADDPRTNTDRYGFRWDHVTVLRYADLNGTKVLAIRINDTDRLEVYVSPTGRSVRVFDGKGRELKPEPPIHATTVKRPAP